MQLVRDIDQSYIKREMARALKAFADKMEAQIIAEGIEREGERAGLRGPGHRLRARDTCSAVPPSSRASSSPPRTATAEGA